MANETLSELWDRAISTYISEQIIFYTDHPMQEVSLKEIIRKAPKPAYAPLPDPLPRERGTMTFTHVKSRYRFGGEKPSVIIFDYPDVLHFNDLDTDTDKE